MVNIHPTAVVDSKATLGKNVRVGPYSIIGADVVLGDNNEIAAHVVIDGNTSIGDNNRFFPFSSIGAEPQSITYKDEPTETRIGNNNVFRENVTIHRGTMIDEGITSIDNDNFFMAYVHIAHDCRLGSNLVFANCASLAGHVHVGDHAILSGFTLIHQFCRVGAHCITGVGSVCVQDIPPYTLVAGNKAITHGINVKGLRRRDFSSDDISDLKRVYRLIYRSGLTMKDAIKQIQESKWKSQHIATLVDFISTSKRGVIR